MEERILNLRRRAARNERKKHEENGVQLPKGKPGRKRKSLNHASIPDIPEGETEETMEDQRKEIIKIHRNGTQDLPRIKTLMNNTFPKRRRNVLQDNARIWQILEDYPCLKDDKGIEV